MLWAQEREVAYQYHDNNSLTVLPVLTIINSKVKNSSKVM